MLEAALAVFAEKGYSSATLDEVAERAEFGKGTLYNYFPNGKEEILFALIDDTYEAMVSHIESYFAAHEGTQTTRNLFCGFVEHLLAYFLDRQAVFMLLIKEAQRLLFDGQEARAQSLFQHRERLAAVLARPIEAAMAGGTLRWHNSQAVAHLLLGNIHGVLMAITCAPHSEAPIPPDPAIGAEFITSILFDGLLVEPTAPEA